MGFWQLQRGRESLVRREYHSVPKGEKGGRGWGFFIILKLDKVDRVGQTSFIKNPVTHKGVPDDRR